MQGESAKPRLLVGPGNPTNSAASRTKTHRARSCYRMVALATRPPSRRSKSSHQTKITTVMLRHRLISAHPNSRGSEFHEGEVVGIVLFEAGCHGAEVLELVE